MPIGRQSKPLFDLLTHGPASDARRASSAHAKPVVRVEVKPQPAADRAATDEPRPLTTFLHASHEDAAEIDAETQSPPGASVRVPLNYLYLAAAGVVVVLLLAWVGGVKYGSSQEAARTERELAGAFRDRPALREPAESPTGVPQAVQPSAARPQAPAPIQPSPAQPAAPAPYTGTGITVLSSRGPALDPREREMNYLALATLPQADTEAAIAFLAANGLQCVGVPVDRRAGAANNQGPALFKLFALPGITSEQYGNKATARTNLEAAVARLGNDWQNKHRGTSDFGMPGWEKLK